MSPAHYCYVVAKFVFLEYLRRPEQSQPSLEDLTFAPQSGDSPSPAIASLAQERMECLELCLGKITEPDRELILEYYQGEQRTKIERRANLAERLKLTLNALSIRACRIRNKLEDCVRKCCDKLET